TAIIRVLRDSARRGIERIFIMEYTESTESAENAENAENAESAEERSLCRESARRSEMRECGTGKGRLTMTTQKRKRETTERNSDAGKSVLASSGTDSATQLPLTGLSSAVAQLPPRYVSDSPKPPQTLRCATHAAAPVQRTHRQTGVRQRFGELRAALADGWEIVQPIFARPLWSAAANSLTAFRFVLRRQGATRLLTVPEGRTVHRFVRDHQLIVDYRR